MFVGFWPQAQGGPGCLARWYRSDVRHRSDIQNERTSNVYPQILAIKGRPVKKMATATALPPPPAGLADGRAAEASTGTGREVAVKRPQSGVPAPIVRKPGITVQPPNQKLAGDISSIGSVPDATRSDYLIIRSRRGGHVGDGIHISG